LKRVKKNWFYADIGNRGMILIQAKSYIENGFSIDDVQKLNPAIQAVLQENEITIDFSGIKFFTTLFFNNALAKYVLRYGPDEYKKKFKVINLSEVGEITYAHSIQNAEEYYALSKDQKNVYQEIIQNEDD
jgi:hypothetical protein